MKLRKLTLWALLLLPLLFLFCGILVANVYYQHYLNQLAEDWHRFPQVPISATDTNGIEDALKKQVNPKDLTPVELNALANAIGNWLETQKSGSLDAFQAFRMAGIKEGEIIASRDLCAYYRQFLGADQNLPTRFRETDSPELIQTLFQSQQAGNELTFNGKRLCLSCIESISPDSMRVSVAKGEENPLNVFMNEEDRLSMESFTGVFDPVGSFRRQLEGLTERSKTTNVSFLVSSGDGNRKAYKCGLQFIWLPERKVWFPIELMVGWPGARMPMEAFLF